MGKALEMSDALAQIAALELQMRLRPTSGVAGALAGCYFTAGRTEEALPLAQKAWEKNKSPQLGMNLGLILKDLGQHSQSHRVMEAVYQLEPSDPYVALGYGEAMLRAGFWKQAWPVYDNARATQYGMSLEYGIPANVPEWQGQDIGSDLLFVIPEGGMGDRICYPRFIQSLDERGINWVMMPHPELRPFMEKMLPSCRLAKMGDELPIKHWVTAFALPAKLNIGPNEIPLPLPFAADEQSIHKNLIKSPDGLPLIGLCWRAGELHQGGRTVRSLTEGQAMRLVCMTADRVHWINLQHNHPMPYPVNNTTAVTWADYAGLIHHLDSVVTVDTGVMHLSGSMGKPTFTLLAGNSCWKFLDKGECPWYPSNTLFRNETRGLERAVDEVIQYIRARYAPAS